MPDIKFNAVEPGYTATDLTAGTGHGRPAPEIRLSANDAPNTMHR